MVRVYALALCFGLVVGCGPDDPTRVTVPEQDDSPPTGSIALVDSASGRTLAEASRPGSPHSGELELTGPDLRGTTVGEDPNGGIARVRVSISERVSCRGDDGMRFERLRRRYFPPPQIEQIRAAPGARLPTRSTRSRLLSLALDRCGAKAEATEVHGKLWGEVINGHGLETITPALRFSWARPGRAGTGSSESRQFEQRSPNSVERNDSEREQHDHRPTARARKGIPLASQRRADNCLAERV